MTMELNGSCTCGQVTFQISSDPAFQLYCHCTSCRTAQGAPFIGAALFPEAAVKISGELVTSTVTQLSDAARRMHCPRCGVRVTGIPRGGPPFRAFSPWSFTRSDWFSPTVHLFYSERVVNVDDGLPKFVDAPAELGGTGRMA